MIMDNSTIAAVATPGGRGGIGIIKISGPQAASIAKSIFRPHSSGTDLGSPTRTTATDTGNGQVQSHKLIYGQIVDPETERVLDEVLVSVMNAPRTYTKEDVVEINAHGGSVVLQAILSLVLRQGARLAEPGEFTRRAFLNGRIDLTQAEAVIDLISAQTERSLQIAAAQVDGRLRKEVESIREHLMQILSRAQAAIDFPEDVDDIIIGPKTVDSVRSRVVQPIENLIQNYLNARVIRDGLNVAVVGRPNVGKSSLMNRLLRKDRAIVTEIPGTTRDVIEDTVNLHGIPVILSDTAGLHKTDDAVETIGIEKTIEHVNGSDLVLFLVEAQEPISEEDHHIFDTVKTKPLIIAVNKIDLVGHDSDVMLPESWSAFERVYISALYGQGIDLLKELIVKAVSGEAPIDQKEMIVPNLRHKAAFENSFRSAQDMIAGFQNGTSMDLIAINIQEAIDALDEILGTNVKVDVLDQIFSQFCIGK